MKAHNHAGVLSDAVMFSKEYPLAIIGCLDEGDKGRAHVISTLPRHQLVLFLEGTLKGLRGDA